MEYGLEMEWKKFASMEYGKIVFHSIPRPAYGGLGVEHRAARDHGLRHYSQGLTITAPRGGISGPRPPKSLLVLPQVRIVPPPKFFFYPPVTLL